MTDETVIAPRLSAHTSLSRPTFCEFFCGGGMARAGLGAGWACLLANDNDDRKAASYAANWGRSGLVVADIANISAADLPGRADLAHASPPCVGVSLAGGRKGLGPEAWTFMRLMQEKHVEGRAPRIIMVENVPDLLTSLDGEDFDRVCGAFIDMGYRVGAVVVDAALFVPQSRERLFVIAVRNSVDVPSAIIVDRPGLPFHSEAVVKALRRQKAAPIWWRLPVPPAHNLTLADILDDRGMRWDAPAKTAEIIGTMEQPHLDRLDEDKRAGGLLIRSLNSRTRDGIPRWESRPDLIANCLRTAGGGSSIQRLLFVDGTSVRTRKISPVEYARAMGLPDSYRLPAGLTAPYNLIGDGVVVPVVRWLAEHILEPILRAPDLSLAAENFAPCRRIEEREKTMTKPMFSEDGENRCLLTEEELYDECLHAAATIVVALVLGCEFLDCRLNDDGYKWPTPISRIELMSANDWGPEEALSASAAIHEAGSLAVAKRQGRGHHLIRLGKEHSGTPKLLDDPKVWKAIEALAQFIRDNYEGEGCYGALGTASPGGDFPALKLIKSMDLPCLTFA